MSHTKVFLASLVALLSVALAPAAGGAQEATAQVTVVHGLRGQLVDVYLDGARALTAFAPDRVTDPITIPAGVHRVELRPAQSAVDSAPRASGSLNVVAGSSLSVVAHYAPDGSWRVTPYTNDVSPLPPGQSRLVVRHTAAAPAISIVLDGAASGAALANPGETARVLPAATHSVRIDSVDGQPLVAADNVAAPEGAALGLYLVGSQRDGSLTWLAQSITGMATAPAGAATGNSGLAAAATNGGDRGVAGVGVAALALVAGLGLVTASLSAQRRMVSRRLVVATAVGGRHRR